MMGVKKALFILVIFSVLVKEAVNSDDEFAEFEQFDDEEFETVTTQKPPVQKQESARKPPVKEAAKPVVVQDHSDDDAAVVENEDDTFLSDDEEFENANGESVQPSDKKKVDSFKEPTVLNVPLPRRGRLEAYVAELFMLAVIALYFLNYLSGRSKNIKLAHGWLDAHRELLDSNFALVGDDGQEKEPSKSTVLLKNAEHIYNLWCSGRVNCEGLLVELRFIKRQCLLHVAAQLFKPQCDKIILRVTMEKETADTFVMAVGTKKAIASLHKEMTDLASFCGDKKRGESFGLPAQYQVLSEIHEAAEAVLDSRMLNMFEQYSEYIEYIHVSDQYSGVRADKEQTNGAKMPDTESTFVFCLNVPGHSADDMAKMRPLLQYCLHFIDRYARLRLSREAKGKADKNRQKMLERYMKEQHAQRQEEAQKKREDKIRQEKEKIMEMDDEKRQNKLEARQMKKEMKKRQKGKVMKVKM